MEIEITNNILISYIITTNLLVWYILRNFINTNKSYIKIILTLIVNCIVGGLYICCKIGTLEQVLTSFTVSIVLYEWLIKHILKKINLNADNNKGINI